MEREAAIWSRLGGGLDADALGLLSRNIRDDNVARDTVDLAPSFAREFGNDRGRAAAQLLVVSNEIDHHAIMHMDGDQVLLAQSSEDFAEAVQAFFQKPNLSIRLLD